MHCPLERKIDPGNTNDIHFNQLSNTTGMCHIKEPLAQCAPSQHGLLLINWHDLASTTNGLSAHVCCIVKNTKVIVRCFAKCLWPPLAAQLGRNKSLQAGFQSCTGVTGCIFIFRTLLLKYYLDNKLT